MSILIQGGRIVTHDRDEIADVYIDGEKVAAIGPSLEHRAEVILDASHRIVIPGGIDVHTHLDAPVGGTQSSDDFETGTRAAAFGGTTTIIDFATQRRGGSLAEAFALWLQKGERAVIDFGLHMIVVDLPPYRLAELDALVAQGVTSFKLFMAYPGALMVDDAMLLSVLERSRDLGALVCVHAENGGVIQHLITRALAAGNTAPVYHALTRPPITEGEATFRAAALAALAHCPLYIVHVTCREAVEALAEWRRRGVRAYGETCPHYLLLSEDELRRPGFEGARYVLTPPLRTAEHQEVLWSALADGSLQTVATDHCPFFFATQKLADTTDFTRIPNGGPGIEHRLELLYHYGVVQGRITLQRWVQLISTMPARLFGLYPQKGTIAVGSDADLVLWDPAAQRTISATNHHMRVDYSLYEGFRVTGAAATVIARGEVILHAGTWTGSAGRGRFLKRSPGGLAHETSS